MKRIEICETIKLYHLIEVDDVVDVDDVIAQANADSSKFETGCEVLEHVLSKLQRTYGIEYEIKPNYCGMEIEGINAIDEVD